MPGRLSADKVLTDATRILTVWTENPTFSMGTATRDNLQALIEELQNLDAGLEEKRIQLGGLMDQRDDLTRAINELATRARSGFRATFGPDSIQYAQAGGTRTSERKSPTRKPRPKEL